MFATTSSGTQLAIDRVRGGNRGAVICLHAMMTDGRYFGARRNDSFAAYLAGHGLDVFVADFRGHGASQPPTARTADWSFDDLVELDLPAIVDACAHAAECAPRELSILGHSLGGLVACAALATGRIPAPRRLLLASTSVWLGGALHRRALMSVYRNVTRVLGHAPIRALRAGTADEARTYVEQLTTWARTERWTSLRGVDYFAALPSIEVPAQAWVGGADWMCRPADADAICKRLPHCAPLEVIDGANHFTLFEQRRFRDAVATAASA